MSEILVTGASGLIGQGLVSHLRLDGHVVTTVTLASEPTLGGSEFGLDLAEPGHMDALLASGFRCDTVVHLAGRVDIKLQPGATLAAPPMPGDASLVGIYRDNVLATANVARFCLGASVPHLVFASSQTVYGHPMEYPLTERSRCQPLEHYAASKLCAEHLLEVLSRQGTAVTVLRCSGVFSEGRRSGVVRAFADQAVREGRIVVDAAYPLPLDVIHLDDVLDAFALAAGGAGSGYRCLNISTGEPCSLTVLADAIAALVPGCMTVHQGVAQPVVQLDNAAARSTLGWNPLPRVRRLAAMVAAVCAQDLGA